MTETAIVLTCDIDGLHAEIGALREKIAQLEKLLAARNRETEHNRRQSYDRRELVYVRVSEQPTHRNTYDDPMFSSI